MAHLFSRRKAKPHTLNEAVPVPIKIKSSYILSICDSGGGTLYSSEISEISSSLGGESSESAVELADSITCLQHICRKRGRDVVGTFQGFNKFGFLVTHLSPTDGSHPKEQMLANLRSAVVDMLCKLPNETSIHSGMLTLDSVNGPSWHEISPIVQEILAQHPEITWTVWSNRQSVQQFNAQKRKTSRHRRVVSFTIPDPVDEDDSEADHHGCETVSDSNGLAAKVNGGKKSEKNTSKEDLEKAIWDELTDVDSLFTNGESYVPSIVEASPTKWPDDSLEGSDKVFKKLRDSLEIKRQQKQKASPWRTAIF